MQGSWTFGGASQPKRNPGAPPTSAATADSSPRLRMPKSDSKTALSTTMAQVAEGLRGAADRGVGVDIEPTATFAELGPVWRYGPHSLLDIVTWIRIAAAPHCGDAILTFQCFPCCNRSATPSSRRISLPRSRPTAVVPPTLLRPSPAAGPPKRLLSRRLQIQRQIPKIFGCAPSPSLRPPAAAAVFTAGPIPCLSDTQQNNCPKLTCADIRLSPRVACFARQKCRRVRAQLLTRRRFCPPRAARQS